VGTHTRKKTRKRKRKIRNWLVSLVYLYVCLFLFWKGVEESSGSVAQAFDISYRRAQVQAQDTTRLNYSVSSSCSCIPHISKAVLLLFVFFSFRFFQNIVVAQDWAVSPVGNVVPEGPILLRSPLLSLWRTKKFVV
jgi:cell division FtsZ-interacting protein ZapD